MCKIAVFTNTKNLDTNIVSEKVGNILLDLEGDGFGYAVKGVKGVYGEKCIDDTFAPRINKKVLNPVSAIVPKYESFGEKSKPIGSMILHGRTSTNDKGLVNCHPMIKKDNFLIHNGVVTDHGKKYKKSTTNDSEDVLHRFLEGIPSVEKNLTGYYAFACIDKEGKLHIVKDAIANLHIGWLEKFDTYLICTTKSLMESIAKSLKAKVTTIDTIKDNIHLIFDGNEMTHCEPISSRGYGEREARHASASLGRSLESYENNYSDSALNHILDTYSDDYDSGTYENTNDRYIDALSEDAFERATRDVNDTYEIYDDKENQITSFEFHKLDPVSKRQCVIYTPEGTCIEYYNMNEAA